jgi:hypothetical protein
MLVAHLVEDRGMDRRRRHAIYPDFGLRQFGKLFSRGALYLML